MMEKINKIENQDSMVTEITNNTKIELDSIIYFSELLNKIDFKSNKIKESVELGEIMNHSQKAFDIANYFLLWKKDEIKKNNGNISDKEVQILDLIHTLKNNFAAFIGFCDLLKEDDLSEEEFKEFSKVIFNEAKKAEVGLENFINGQLKNNELKISEIDLGSCIGSFIGVLKKEAEQKNIDIDNQIKDNVKIMTDSVKLESVLSNLISNAIKFTNQDGSIKIKSENEGNQIKIYIEDNGVGISKEHQANFFDNIGQTTLGTSGEEGTGVGIYTINKLVQEMGGTISVKSEGEGKGTQFIVTLPVTEK
ncbi:MAG TPA: HAMP domain-containing sensor histidine kinase [Candidatus Paceibacterota bacterium]